MPLNNDIDLVLFAGDAYKSREPSQTQQREFAKRINRIFRQPAFPSFCSSGTMTCLMPSAGLPAPEIFDHVSH